MSSERCFLLYGEDGKILDSLPELCSIKITDDETFFKYMAELMKLELDDEEKAMLQRCIDVIKLPIDTEIDKIEFGIDDTIGLIELMEKFPSEIETISACSEYITSCVKHITDFNEETVNALLDFDQTIVDLLLGNTGNLTTDEIKEVKKFLDQTD